MLKKKKPGFTLVEMTIVVALIVIVLVITSSMFITGNKVFSDSNVKSTLQIEGQAIQEKISDIVMQAKSVTYISETEMRVMSYDKDGKEQEYGIKKDGTSICITTYDKDGNKVSSQSLSKYITKFEIIYKPDQSNPNSVDVNLELTKQNVFSNNRPYPINFSITFRNKNILDM